MQAIPLAANERIIEADFKVTYNTENPPSVKDVIKSLSSLEYLIQKGALFLEAAYPNIKIVSTNVYVQDIKAGSLYEWLKVTCLTRAIGEDNLQKLEDVFNDILQDSGKVNSLIMLGAGAFIGAGIVAGSGLLSDDEVQPVNTYNKFNIVNVAQDAGITSEQIESIVATNINRKVATSAVKFVQPAKDENATISLGANETLTIPSKMVKNAPSVISFVPLERKESYSNIEMLSIPREIVKKVPNVTNFVPLERKENYSNIDLYIYASDQDNSNHGWAGIAPELFEKRVKFELGEELDPFTLHSAGKKIKANITLVKKYDQERQDYIPEKIIIHNTIT